MKSTKIKYSSLLLTGDSLLLLPICIIIPYLIVVFHFVIVTYFCECIYLFACVADNVTHYMGLMPVCK